MRPFILSLVPRVPSPLNVHCSVYSGIPKLNSQAKPATPLNGIGRPLLRSLLLYSFQTIQVYAAYRVFGESPPYPLCA